MTTPNDTVIRAISRVRRHAAEHPRATEPELYQAAIGSLTAEADFGLVAELVKAIHRLPSSTVLQVLDSDPQHRAA
jgi:hypothetical protein